MLLLSPNNRVKKKSAQTKKNEKQIFQTDTFADSNDNRNVCLFV